MFIVTDSIDVILFNRLNRQKIETGTPGLKLSKTGRQVNLAEKHIQRDGAVDRRTGEAVRTLEKSGSHPDSTARLAGVRPQRHTGLCPWTAVHPLIGDGSKLF